LTGRTTCRRLVPGATFRLRGGPRDDLDRAWLVLEVSHEGGDFGARATAEGRRYEASFVAVPGAHAYRPRRGDAHTRRPTLGGVQTATVTGPAGAEIHTEAHGRIKAHLRWDRVRPNDDTSSQWLRPVQAPTSGGFLLPRIGWEVLLGFGRVSADEPFELGRLYHAAAPPPEALPVGKVRSAFGTLTTPGGGSGNLLRMDDTAGNEGMTLGASKDLNERTENDKVVNITGDDVHTVGSNRTETVGILKTETVDVLQSYTVSATRDVTTVGRLTISAASESVLVGGLRLFQVGGDYETQAAVLGRTVGGLKAETAIQEVNRHVTGASSVMVGGSWTEIGGLSASTSVLGASSLAVGGPMSIQAKSYSLKASTLKETLASRTIHASGKRIEGIKGAAKYSIGGALSLHGSAVVFKADSKITIQASGATITVTPSSITIDGAFDASDASVVTGDETND
jgi:type VI secretion system secreted protein VgrG